jgi:hypothetical protein
MKLVREVLLSEEETVSGGNGHDVKQAGCSDFYRPVEAGRRGVRRRKAVDGE